MQYPPHFTDRSRRHIRDILGVMARTEIIINSGKPDNVVFEEMVIEGPNAIKEGYKRFLEIIDSRADWLLAASVKRDFDDNMHIEIGMRIGPWPFWSKEYLQEHKIGKYACNLAEED